MAHSSFNINRVGWLIRRDYVEHWKTHLRFFLALFAGSVITALFIFIAQYYSNPYNLDDEATISIAIYRTSEVMTGIGLLALIVASVWSASKVFSIDNERSKRISTLMLPATTSEKVVARFLNYNVGTILMTIIALAATDLFNFVIAEAYGYDYTSFLSQMFQTLSRAYTLNFGNSVPQELWLGSWSVDVMPLYTLFLLWSVYLWGGAFFRKKPIIMTSLVCFVVFLITFVGGTTFFIHYMTNHILDGQYMDNGVTPHAIIVGINIVYTLLWCAGLLWFVLNIFFACRLRKRASLVPRHWYGQ